MSLFSEEDVTVLISTVNKDGPETDRQGGKVNKSLGHSTRSNLKHLAFNLFKGKIKEANPNRSEDLVDWYKNRLKEYYYNRFGLSSLSAFTYLIFFELSDEEILSLFLSPVLVFVGLLLSSYRWWLNYKQNVLSNNKDWNSFAKVVLNGLIIVAGIGSLVVYGAGLLSLSTFYVSTIVSIGLLMVYIPKSMLKIGQTFLWLARGLKADPDSDRYDECWGRAGKYFWSAVYSVGMVVLTGITSFTDFFSFGASKLISVFVLLSLSALNTFYEPMKDTYRKSSWVKRKKHSSNPAEQEKNPKLSERTKVLSYLDVTSQLFETLKPEQIDLLQQTFSFLSSKKRPDILEELLPEKKETFMDGLKNLNNDTRLTLKEVMYLKKILESLPDNNFSSLVATINRFIIENQNASASLFTRTKIFFGFATKYPLKQVISAEMPPEQQELLQSAVSGWIRGEESYAASVEASIAIKIQEAVQQHNQSIAAPNNTPPQQHHTPSSKVYSPLANTESPEIPAAKTSPLQQVAFNYKEIRFLQSRLNQHEKKEVQEICQEISEPDTEKLEEKIPVRRFIKALTDWHVPGPSAGRFGYVDLAVSLMSIKKYCDIFPKYDFYDEGKAFLCYMIQKKLQSYNDSFSFSSYMTKKKTEQKKEFLEWYVQWLSSSDKRRCPLIIDTRQEEILIFKNLFDVLQKEQNYQFAINLFSSSMEPRGEIEILLKLGLYFFEITPNNRLQELDSAPLIANTPDLRYDDEVARRSHASSYLAVLKNILEPPKLSRTMSVSASNKSENVVTTPTNENNKNNAALQRTPSIAELQISNVPILSFPTVDDKKAAKEEDKADENLTLCLEQ